VTIEPPSSMTKPEPVDSPRCGFDERRGLRRDDLGGDVDDAGRIAFVDVTRRQRALLGVAIRRRERRLPNDGLRLAVARDPGHEQHDGDDDAADQRGDEGHRLAHCLIP